MTEARIRDAINTVQTQIRIPVPTVPRTMSPEARKHLRELGYVE